MLCFKRVLNSFKHKKLSFCSIVFILVLGIFKFLKSLKTQVILGNLVEDIKKITDAFPFLIPSSTGFVHTLGFVHNKHEIDNKRFLTSFTAVSSVFRSFSVRSICDRSRVLNMLKNFLNVLNVLNTIFSISRFSEPCL